MAGDSASSDLPVANSLCFKLCEILEIAPSAARVLLNDPESFDEDGNPEMNRALALFWKTEAQNERAQRQEDREMHLQSTESVRRQSEELKLAAQTRTSEGLLKDVKKGGASGYTQTLDVPDDWEAGSAPKGGLHYATFRRKLNEVMRYNRKTGEDGPKLTLKSLVDDELKAGMEGRCGLPKYCWNPATDKKHPGMTEEDFLNAVRKSLRPARKADFKSALENMKMEDRGLKGPVLLESLTVWGIKWLAKLRESEDAGVKLSGNWLKITFKDAIDINPFKRWLRGKSWPKRNGPAVWYRYLCDKLKKKASHADEDWRERNRADGGSNYYRGKRTFGESGPARGGYQDSGFKHTGDNATGQFQGNERTSTFRNFSAGDNDGYNCDGADFNNHSGGTEPMQYQWSRGGGGSARGRGGSSARGNLQGSRETRAPVNNPDEETVSKLPKGKFWHDSNDPACCCRSADCGARQDVPFCQGCGQHHHTREFCYKAKDSRYNATGYWSENRKGQPPIQSLGGTYPGSPNKGQAQYQSSEQPKIPPPPEGKSAGFNMMESGAGRA